MCPVRVVDEPHTRYCPGSPSRGTSPLGDKMDGSTPTESTFLLRQKVPSVHRNKAVSYSSPSGLTLSDKTITFLYVKVSLPRLVHDSCTGRECGEIPTLGRPYEAWSTWRTILSLYETKAHRLSPTDLGRAQGQWTWMEHSTDLEGFGSTTPKDSPGRSLKRAGTTQSGQLDSVLKIVTEEVFRRGEGWV